MTGNELVVALATDANGALSSTAAQVVNAINANPGAAAVLKATATAGSRSRAPGSPRPRRGRGCRTG